MRRAQAEITPQEFKYWVAYDRLDPYGRDRVDLNSGIIAATIANVNRGKNSKAFVAGDFMPNFEKSETRQTPKKMFALMKMFTAAHQKGKTE